MRNGLSAISIYVSLHDFKRDFTSNCKSNCKECLIEKPPSLTIFSQLKMARGWESMKLQHHIKL